MNTCYLGEMNVFSGVAMWGCDLDLNFHLVLDLCDDLSSLGTKLLAEATQLGASHLEANEEGKIFSNKLA
jgi:hypothetical protein